MNINNRQKPFYRIAAFLTAFLIIAAASIFAPAVLPAQENTDGSAGGGTEPFRLLSPSGIQDFTSVNALANGTNSTFLNTPQSGFLNPAASADIQAVTLHADYLSLAGLGDAAGFGHSAHLGFAIPTRIGVFGGYGGFFTSPFASLYDTTFGFANIHFAKDLYSTFYIGAGLSASFGEDWGLGLDLGFLHLPTNTGIIKNFKWGGGIRWIGKDYGYPAFTPAFGMSFDLVDTDPVTLSFYSDVSFPTFQDVRFSIGTGITLFNFVSINATYLLDVKDYIEDNPRPFPFSFGLAFSIPLGKKEKEDRVNMTIQTAAAPLHEDVWAFAGGITLPLAPRDVRPPEISVGNTPDYVSPDFDGTQDMLEIPLSIEDERFLQGYNIIIQDNSGNVVKTIPNKEQRDTSEGGFKEVWDRFTAVKQGIPVPEQITWDGKSEKGTVVPDGDYSFFIEAWDDNGNRGTSEPMPFTIDTADPEIELSTPYTVFSPNNDGQQDFLIINQEGSREQSWKAQVEDAEGNTIKQFSWESTQPEDIKWDGKNEEGVLPPDGVYRYVITSTDRAGNSTTETIENVIINTTPTPVAVTVSNQYFSPNGDGEQDAVEVAFEVPVTEGLSSWEFTVRDEAGDVVRRFSGEETIPEGISFDGRDEAGRRLPEGAYTGELAVLYINGNNPKEATPELVLDVTPPRATVKADTQVFSPNGDGLKDELTVFQESGSEELWRGVLSSTEVAEEAAVIKEFRWRGEAARRVVWDGRREDGRIAPDGRYTYRLVSTDRAGNRGESEAVELTVDTRETPVRFSAAEGYFSPNADGQKDEVVLVPSVEVEEGVERYEVRIRKAEGAGSGEGAVVRRFTGRGEVPRQFRWDGRDESRLKAADGVYVGELEVEYRHGNRPRALTGEIVLDTEYPEVEEAVAEREVFSPDGDGRFDTLRIRQSTSEEKLWKGEVLTSGGEVVRTEYWEGEAEDFRWDGRDENGNRVADGAYRYKLSSEDEAGNLTTLTLPPVTVDTRPTPVYLTVSDRTFSPNGDGNDDEVVLYPYVGLKEGIESWTLELVHNESGTQKRFSGTTVPPESIEWDGNATYGKAIDGTYRGVLTVTYEKGNRPVATSLPVTLDTLPPQVDITLSPQPFSPDNDGENDELSINIDVEDTSEIEKWSLEILDPVGNRFTDYTGRGKPARTIIWHGISDTGELVQAAESYPLIFTITDELGNQNVIRKNIEVDVLVLKEGNRLKIRISSIIFAPNTADFGNVEEEKAERNKKTLQRLAEILNKYSTYRIRIEGHAVMINWDDPAAAKREQEQELVPLSKARAEAVKEALVEYGVAENRMTTIGLGGSQPIVAFSDLENRWKNRRVEFILLK